MSSPMRHRGVIAWFTRNTVAANLLMWLIVVSGLLVIPVLKKEVFPEMSVQMITVGVAYPGAAPDEVEESICRRIEEAVQGLTGIKRITSSSNENSGAVSIEILSGVDKNAVLADIKNRVDAIDTFPEEAEKPIVTDVVLRQQVINIAVSGDVEEHTLKRLGQRVYDELIALPEITQVELTNTRPYEISIEVSEEALRRWGISLDQVAQAVRRSSLDLPGGSIRTEGGEILLRSLGQARVGAEFERLVLLTRPDGTRITLDQVAKVVDGFEETDQSSRFDGRPSVLLQIYRVGDQSAFEISDLVYDYIDRTQPTMPEGVELTAWRDMSEILQSRMELLIRNAATGLLLVFLVLALFLRFQLAFWVALGIPISFLGAIALMPTFDVSVNMISLFAFIVVLGIVVDDAIVVGENVFKQLRDGKSGVEAAIVGSKQVAVPVVFGVLTTVVAFAPMLDVAGNARALWRQVPLIVIPCLLFSLVESKLILPAHLSHQKAFGSRYSARGLARLWNPIARAWQAMQQRLTLALEWFIEHVYRPSLEVCLRLRYVTLALGVAILAITLSLVAGGWVRFNYFPTVEGDNVVGMLTMPQGTPVEATRRALRQMEDAANELGRELDDGSGGPSVFRHMLTSVSQQPYRLELNQNRGMAGVGVGGAHLGEVNIQLAPSEERSVTSDEVLQRWRDKVGAIPDATEISFTSSMVSTGEDINIQLSHSDIDTLQQVADEVKRQLSTFHGVEDIADSMRVGKREVKLDIKPEAEPLGITLADLARQVRQSFYGAEVQRIQRGRDEVKVMVRYPSDRRRSLADLENMRIRTPAGDEVPFSAVAEATYGRGYAAIKRTDLARTVNVTAEVIATEANTNQILASMQESFVPILLDKYPGLQVSYEGDAREQAQTLDSLMRGYMVALFVIYALMAIPFRSYLQPLIVMSAIPFGLVGAIWGHVVMGMELSIISMLGLVALTGVVVNDSLVLVDYVNRRRDTGLGHLDAVHQAGVARFRPIILTSLTTFASLTPLLLERSVQARFLMPMAVSLAFGVLFATFITLVIVPSTYLILEDFRAAWRWFWGHPAPAAAEPVEPAPVVESA